MRQRITLSRAIVFMILAIMAISFIYPIFFMFLSSLKTKDAYQLNPFSLNIGTLDLLNYKTMLSQFSILRNFRNTFIVVFSSVFSLTLLAVFASYAFAKLRFRGKVTLYLFLVMTMFIPGQVTIIPTFVMFSKLHLVNNFLSVILIYISGGIPGAILLITSSLRGIPGEMLESAKMDGAGYFTIVRHIIVPMGMAAIAINIVMSFIGYWNDLFTPMILLQNENVKTVMVALASLVTRYVSDPTYQMAGMVLAMLPVLIVFAIFQRFIVQGITVGAIK